MQNKKVSEFLTESEIKAVLRVPDRRTLKGKRDYALLKLMLSTGLRKAEICSLSTDQVKTYRNQAVIDVIGKGSKHRRIGLNNDVIHAIIDYQRALKTKTNTKGHVKDKSQNRPLFFNLGERGGYEIVPITHKAVDCLIKRVKKAALINKRITPHTTRHTFATTLLDKGTDLRTVQALLGHSHIRTTEQYLHTNDEKMLDAVSKLRFDA